MKLVIENTLYSIFIYSLLEEKWKDSIFFLEEKLYNSIGLNLKERKIKVEKIYLGYKKNLLKFYKKKIEYIYTILKVLIKGGKIYGNDSIIILPFPYEFYLIEDGIMNYSINSMPQIKISIKKIVKSILKLENPFYKPYGFSKKIKLIYFTGIYEIPEEFKKKSKIIHIKELWDKKTKIEKEEILKIFNFNFKIIELFKMKKNILFTQPLSEDNIISEEEKINLYKKILKNYDLNKTLIKKHPREVTNYKKYFPNIEVMEQNFPSEILNLLNIKFERAITIFSTAALTLNEETKIDFYGSEIHPKILKRFGSMKNIMETNAFIR